VVKVEELLFRGHPEVVDADPADYFGSIPHAELLQSVARRIVDRRVLHLIKMWLECPVEETDDRGRKTRTTEAGDNRRSIPQGSPISPLLANTYMRRFVALNHHGLELNMDELKRGGIVLHVTPGWEFPEHHQKLIAVVKRWDSARFMRGCGSMPATR
jgi:retron-type reverse transcriptase